MPHETFSRVSNMFDMREKVALGIGQSNIAAHGELLAKLTDTSNILLIR